MSDLFSFVWAVINSWAGYATGGLIVALVALWSTLRQKPVPRKLGVVLAIVFLLLAFFHAWRDQLNQKRDLFAKLDDIQRRQDELKQTADQLQNMKADQTIVQVTAVMLALETVQPFRERQPIFVNIAYANTGAYRVHNFHFHSQLQFVAGDKDVDGIFQSVYAKIESFNKEGSEGQVIDPANQQPLIASMYIVPTAEEVQAFYAKQKVLAVAIRIEYNDTLWYERCAYLNPLNLHGKSELWNVCTSHNKAGQHSLGRLF